MTLSIQQLQCSRNDHAIFRKLSFTLNAGGVIWVEGENGSGKTTLLRIVCGLFVADEGSIHWHGKLIHKTPDVYYRQLLYIGHQNALKLDLTPLENLKSVCGLSGQVVTDNDVDNALYKMGLAGYEDVLVRQMSQGQQRRVALTRMLLTDTLLWVLDEPFVALDAASVELLQSVMVEHVENGGMIILTTHQAVSLPAKKVQRLSLDQYV